MLVHLDPYEDKISPHRFHPLTSTTNFVMEVYLARNEQRTGPHTATEVQAMVAAHEIDRSCLAWREGMADWLPLGEVVPLTTTAPPSPFPAGLPPIPVRMAKKAGIKGTIQTLEKRVEASPAGPLIARHEKWVGPIIGAILIMLVKFGCHH